MKFDVKCETRKSYFYSAQQHFDNLTPGYPKLCEITEWTLGIVYLGEALQRLEPSQAFEAKQRSNKLVIVFPLSS